MNNKKQLQIIQMVEQAIEQQKTIPLLFKYIDYENDMTLLLNDIVILEQLEKHILEHNINFNFTLDYQPQKKVIIIQEMMKLILVKGDIQEMLVVNSMKVRLKYYFWKVNCEEGINLLGEYDLKTLTLSNLKNDFLVKQVMNQEEIPVPWILDSIFVDKDDIKLKLTKELKIALKSHQLPIGQYLEPLRENEAQIINKLLILNRNELGGYVQRESVIHLYEQLKDKEQFKEGFQNLSYYFINPQIREMVQEDNCKKTQDIFKPTKDFHQKYKKKVLIFKKIKTVYLNYICQKQILIPELLQYIQITRRKTESIKLRIQATSTFRQELSLQTQLQQLNQKFNLDIFFKQDFDWEQIHYYEQQVLPSFNNLLLDEDILLYGIVVNLQQNQNIIREQLLTQLWKPNIIDLINNQHLFEDQSIQKSIINLLKQMKDSLSQNKPDLQNSEFRKAFIKMSAENNKIMHFNTHPFIVKNLRKLLEQMVQKHYSFAEIIEYIFLCINKFQSQLRINKNETLLQLLEQDPQIQIFMHKVLSEYNENNYFDKIKLSDFEQIPLITPKFKMNDEQKCIIHLLEIVYQQKEQSKDKLIQIMNKDKVKSLIYELEQTQLKPSGRQGLLQSGYNLLYSLYQWVQQA